MALYHGCCIEVKR